jgi:hypothetical protein
MRNETRYLLDIAECINRIEEYTHEGRDAFIQQRMIQDAVVRNFARFRRIDLTSTFFHLLSYVVRWRNRPA